MTFLQDYGFIVGGLIFLITALFKRNSASQLNQYINTINMLRVDIVTMKKEISDGKKEMNAVKDELHDKDKIVSLLEATSWDLPFPYWLKDMQYKMLYINSQYQKVFCINAVDYIGKRDIDVWGEDTAGKFRENDQKVIDSDKEYIIDENELDGYVVIKWKRRAGNIIIGIAGMCIPVEEFYDFRINTTQ